MDHPEFASALVVVALFRLRVVTINWDGIAWALAVALGLIRMRQLND
jgi:hypothetical protein